MTVYYVEQSYEDCVYNEDVTVYNAEAIYSSLEKAKTDIETVIKKMNGDVTLKWDIIDGRHVIDADFGMYYSISEIELDKPFFGDLKRWLKEGDSE